MPIQPTSAYYLARLTSQYQNSPNLKALLALLIQPFLDTAACANSLVAAFNVNTAVGVQLDVIGKIVGAGRTLPFSPLGVNALTTEAITSTGSQAVTTNNTNYLTAYNIFVYPPQALLQVDTGGNLEIVRAASVTPGVGFTATFTKTHLTGVPVVQVNSWPSLLLDADYRLLILAKILQNQWNGHGDGALSTLWQAWQVLFPGGRIYITDNQNMTCTVFIVGLFSPLQQQMITNGLIVPRPEAVEYNYEFPTVLPGLGFGSGNPGFIAGFGTGHWEG